MLDDLGGLLKLLTDCLAKGLQTFMVERLMDDALSESIEFEAPDFDSFVCRISLAIRGTPEIWQTVSLAPIRVDMNGPPELLVDRTAIVHDRPKSERWCGTLRLRLLQKLVSESDDARYRG